MLDEVVDRVESTIMAIARQGSDFLKESELDVRIAEVKRKTEQLVKEHPVESLVVGVVVGYFIGRLFSRNR
jgi:ElaB/YqjD/DUF883 family membrane-anchored ribosome-binding protein